ncbi:MAG TPA: general secretion pathway protein GspB [Tahibacter sp.]|uniref:general secretion pathway protein GspB n=1 Tax=Tahibacter sp. TaxID=2056211 RepID=UPI002CA68F8C|nr:general secretion pathway protein GspB [Tahibacter sp.]HSX62216.1 general secretion pathway protein GspB [Tahibacter sp.]
MSLIHEALKKAEQQRRLGEPPNLGTPFARAPRRRSLLPFLAVAIVGTLGAGWYLSRTGTPDEAPAAAKTDKPATAPAEPRGAGAGTAATASATGGAPASAAAERRPAIGANAAANPNVAAALPAAPRVQNQAPSQPNPPTVQDVAERESEPHPPGANPLAPGEAAPLALGTPPPETSVNDPEGLAAKQAVKEKEFATAPRPAAEPGRSPFIKERPQAPPSTKQRAQPDAARAGFVPPDQKAPPPKPPVADAPPSKPPVAAAAAPPPATGAAAPPAAPALEQLPAYWQLPYNVRKELPELKLSMHVYSATPAQRFVVLNGNRQVEGDELGGDVRVTEIRTDGVVLTYHGQRFLVPRGGS